MEDQPADSGDLTTETAGPPAASAGRRRGWRLPWRRAKDATPHPDPVPEASSEPAAPADEPARRMPTGKARRTAKADAATGDAAEGAQPEPASVTDETVSAEQTAPPEVASAEETAPPEVASAEEPAPTVEQDEPVADDPTDTGDTGASDADASEPAPDPEPVLVPHRPAGKRLLAAAATASVLFVGAGAFAGAMLQPYLSDRAAVDTKLEIAKTAADAITTLWSYTPDDMATLPERSSRYLSGEFASEYRRYIDAIVSTNQQAQVTNTTQVMGTAVETLTPSEATAIVYTNSVSMSPVTKNVPSLRYLSYRLTLERDGGDWLITGMNSITSLDLTPQV